MSKRLLDYDPLTRTKTWHHYDHQTRKTTLQTEQDVQPYIERNKRLALTPEYQSRGKKLDFFHIATIPNNVIVMLKQSHGVDVFNKDDLPRLERLLMSSEFKYLRVADRI